MIRNFAKGIVWGGVVALVGLGALSLLSPMPAHKVANQDSPVAAPPPDTSAKATTGSSPSATAPEPEPKPATTSAPAPAATPAPVSEPAPASTPEPVAETAPTLPAQQAPADTVVPEPAPAATAPTTANAAPEAAPIAPATAPETTPPEAVADAESGAVEPAPPGDTDTASTSQAATGAEQAPSNEAPAQAPVTAEIPAQPPILAEGIPAAPDAPVPGSALPQVGVVADTPPAAANPSALPQTGAADSVPAKADLPPAVAPAPKETLLTPAPDAPAALAPAQIVLDEVQDSQPEPAPEPASKPDTLPPADHALPTVLDGTAPSTLPPSDGLPPAVDGVAEDRLPQIGDAPASTAEPTAPPPDNRPIVAFARSFENDSGKPAFALVLRDNGALDLDRSQLAALPFPISFVIDPAQPGAAEAAAIYRAAGQEVVMLASGIPAGATAADLEQTFQSNATILPEAVAVMDIGAEGFQDNRPLASLVVPVIGAQGRGVLTFDKGLNAADQVARRDGIPAAVIFRDLDAEGEDRQKIRRYLDRAAFKAAQEGKVVVVGTTRPETISALMEWTVEGRASSVALAPVTAVLSVQ